MADQKVMGDDMLQEHETGDKPLAKIFEMQELFGSKFCDFRGLNTEDKQYPAGLKVHWRDTFLDCIFDECSEVLNWTPWKHWKAYKDFEFKPNELRFELIDILHFVVSEYLVYGIDSEGLIQQYPIRKKGNTDLDTIMDLLKNDLIIREGFSPYKDYYYKSELTRVRLRKIIQCLGLMYGDLAIENAFIQYRSPDRKALKDLTQYLFELFIIWDMGAQDVFNFYMSKNKENFDRQNRGY